VACWDGKRWSRDGADDLVKIAEHDTCGQFRTKPPKCERAASRRKTGGRDFVFAIVKEQPVLYSDKIASWGRASEALNKLGARPNAAAPYFAIGVKNSTPTR